MDAPPPVTPPPPTIGNGPGPLGIPIDDDSSEDEMSKIRALEEDQGIYHNEEVVASPKNESDDDIPLRRFQLSHPTTSPSLVAGSLLEREIANSPLGEPSPNMERRRSVRFSGPHDEEEDGRNKHFRTPSPDSLRYIQALENPMAAHSDLDNEFDDLIDDPIVHSDHAPPLGSPPAYTSGDEGPPPLMKKLTGSSQYQGPLDEIQFNIADKRASRLEEESSNEDEEEDDDDYTEDEIAVLTFIDAYKPQEVELRPQLRPFKIEYFPAMGEVELFIKVPRPDDIEDNVGLTALDEPPSHQSDATIVDMQIRNATKDASILNDEVPVKLLEKPDENPDEIKKWIADIKEFHKSKPAQTVHYRTPLPDIETLMQEWGPKLEDVLRVARVPTAELDVPLEKYVDICLNVLDIPVGKSRIESLHLMFSLLNEFNNSQHFRNLAQNNNLGGQTGETMDRLEL